MRTVEEIYQELLENFNDRASYGILDSCDLAVRLYALAAEIQALEYQADWVLDQSFPQTAQGEYLDSHAAMRGITRQEATCAEGTLRFFVTSPPVSDLTIPEGSVCMTERETRFETTAPAVLAAGTLQVDAPARAVEPGRGGNAVTGSVTVMTACPVGITKVTNPGAFTGGTDEEDDETLRKRVLESFQRLPNGANAAFYEEQALRHENVAAAVAVGRARGVGTVDLYIATAAGLPDEALLEEVSQDLQAKREIAVDLQVLAPTLAEVEVSVELKVAENKDFQTVKTAVEKVVGDWFNGKLLGKSVLLAELGRRVYEVEGVENYHILAPLADIGEDGTSLPTLGTLTVTKMEG